MRVRRWRSALAARAGRQVAFVAGPARSAGLASIAKGAVSPGRTGPGNLKAGFKLCRALAALNLNITIFELRDFVVSVVVNITRARHELAAVDRQFEPFRLQGITAIP